MRETNHQIDNLQSPVRIDKYLAQVLTDYSRSAIQRLIENQLVILNEIPVQRVSEKVKTGDRLRIVLPDPIPSEILPENIPLDIVYDDQHIVVVNKPFGLSVHPTPNHKQGTLVNALLYQVKDLSGIGGELRPGIVHRLDKVTSGVIIIAKHDEAHRKLSAMFKAREIQKTYWAIVHGTIPNLEGIIDQPIARHPRHRKMMAVVPDGRPSVTHYRVMKTGMGGTLVEIHPQTGRTHQIRVHMKHLGYPIVGDRLYARKKNPSRGQLEDFFENSPGIALHAKSLSFTHPLTGSTMTVEAEVHEPFATILDRMP